MWNSKHVIYLCVIANIMSYLCLNLMVYQTDEDYCGYAAVSALWLIYSEIMT